MGRQERRRKQLLDDGKGIGKKLREDKEENVSSCWMMGKGYGRSDGKTRKKR